MKCPRCGAESSVAETRTGEHLTIRRRRVCTSGHRFTTVEMHQSAVHKGDLVRRAKAIAARVAMWHRDIEIARDLHQGWRVLAARYGVKYQAIYMAASRGRQHLKQEKGTTA
jgi:transcriptional regulator NrdR family protein